MVSAEIGAPHDGHGCDGLTSGMNPLAERSPLAEERSSSPGMAFPVEITSTTGFGRGMAITAPHLHRTRLPARCSGTLNFRSHLPHFAREAMFGPVRPRTAASAANQ